jgi:CHAT domain-containing protein/tetratricopeptide (TPR) repeat protein
MRPIIHLSSILLITPIALPVQAQAQPQIQPQIQSQADFTTQAQTLYKSGKIAEAIALYQKIAASNKQTQNHYGEMQALLAIGNIYREQQQFKQAIPILEDITTRIIDTNPDEVDLKLLALYALGRSYSDLGNNTSALTYYQQTLKLSEKKGDRIIHASVLNNMGTVYLAQGDYPKAGDIFNTGLQVVQQAQAIQKAPITRANLPQTCADAKAKKSDMIQKFMANFCSMGLPETQLVETFEKLRSQYINQISTLEQRSLNNLGLVYSHQGDYPKAVQYHEKSLEISQRNNSKSDVATSLNNIANNYISLGNYPKALDLYQQSKSISESIGDRLQLSRTINNIGHLDTQQGDYRKGLEEYQTSLKIALDTGDREQQATLYNNIGTNHQYLSEYNAAKDAYEKSLALHQATGSKSGIATTTNNIGVLLSTIGNYPTAESTLQTALQQAQTLGTPQLIAMTYGNLARIYGDQGKYATSLEFFTKELDIHRKTGDRANEAGSLLQFGSIYRLLGRPAKAQDYCKNALASAQSIGAKSLEGSAIGCLAGIALEQSRYGESATLAQQALSLSRSIGSRRSEIQTLKTLGRIYSALNKQADAETTFTQALSLIRSLNLTPEETDMLTALGAAQSAQGKRAEAQASLTQAIKIAEAIGDRPTSGKAKTSLGEVLLQSQKYAEAETILTAAVTQWESTRPGLTDSDKVSLFEIQSKTYRLLQQALVGQTKSDTALEISERGRARAFVELLASKGQTTQPNQIPNQIPNLSEIRSIAKAQNATIIQYSTISATELYIWVIKPDGTIKFATSKLLQPIAQLVLESREVMGVRGRASIAIEGDNSGDDRAIRATLRQLHQTLIEPIQADLPSNPESRIIFIPQDALFLVPFNALTNDQNNPLIVQHTLTTAPSIQALALTQRLKKPDRSPIPLIVGNPQMPSYQGISLESLPGAETEAKQIAQLFNTQPLIGPQASKATVLNRMKTATLIHLATHGILDTLRGDIPGAIALTPSPGNDGFLTAGELVDLKLTADLVVLSACSTGRGDITGDGVIGLSRSLFIAGVPSVVVSLWNVRDESTALLMTEFYKNLNARKLSKAQALRQAMLTTRKTYPKPADWAAFNLVGEAN